MYVNHTLSTRNAAHAMAIQSSDVSHIQQDHISPEICMPLLLQVTGADVSVHGE
jgi:hypothetical protein